MSLKKVHGEQPKEFKFSSENLKKAEEILKKYPEKNKKSAVMPFLYLAQRQNNNWIPLAAMKYIANFLSMPYISVYEVATFYSMYNLAPVGKHFIQVTCSLPRTFKIKISVILFQFYRFINYLFFFFTISNLVKTGQRKVFS